MFLHVIVQCVTLDECVITKLTTVFLHAPKHDHVFLKPFCVLFAYQDLMLVFHIMNLQFDVVMEYGVTGNEHAFHAFIESLCRNSLA